MDLGTIKRTVRVREPQAAPAFTSPEHAPVFVPEKREPVAVPVKQAR